MPLTIDQIMDRPDPIAPDASMADAVARFQDDPALHALIVAFDGAPLGMLRRETAMELAHSGDALGLRRPLTTKLKDDVFLIGAGVVVGAAAKSAVDAGAIEDGIVVVRDGEYAGYVSPQVLLAALADENAARARALGAAKRNIEAIRQDAKDAAAETARFVAILGHEIRTPLTGVLGVADLLCDARIDEDARSLAKTISQSGRVLDRLLADMLDLSRLGVGKLELAPEPFNLRDFARETQNLWVGRADQRDVSLKVSVAAGAAERLEADAVRLRQILYNLVANALKFTERGGVRVVLETREGAEGLRLIMSVADTGPGISQADKARLFQAFEQASPEAARRQGGAGLGLAVAKGLADQMDGAITLADNPGGGSLFKVDLAVRRAGPRLAVKNAPRPRSANFQLGDVLLVEDHEVSRLVIHRALSAAGWTVETVETEAQAVERAQIKTYQAILLDLHLAEGRGEDAAFAILNGAGPNVRTPLIAVTADATPERRSEALAAGFHSFVDKPIRPRNLVATLADAVMEAEAPLDVRAVRA
ncbi:MAG: ATP-binding protein [Pseudomonadota bacterium]